MLMWCALEDKIPTWDKLQNHFYEGTNMCSLCKSSKELAKHLFVSFPFAWQVWKEFSKQVKLNLIWDGAMVERSFQLWIFNSSHNSLRSLPLIINLGLWISRNNVIFFGKSYNSIFDRNKHPKYYLLLSIGETLLHQFS